MSKVDRLDYNRYEIEQIKEQAATYRGLARQGVPFDPEAAREAAEAERIWTQIKRILPRDEQELPRYE